MAKKVTKTQYKQAKTIVIAYAKQNAKAGAKKAHKSVKAAAKTAGKKATKALGRIFR